MGNIFFSETLALWKNGQISCLPCALAHSGNYLKQWQHYGGFFELSSLCRISTQLSLLYPNKACCSELGVRTLQRNLYNNLQHMFRIQFHIPVQKCSTLPYLIFVNFLHNRNWGQEILYLKVHIFATKMVLRQNCVQNFILCKLLLCIKFYNVCRLLHCA